MHEVDLQGLFEVIEELGVCTGEEETEGGDLGIVLGESGRGRAEIWRDLWGCFGDRRRRRAEIWSELLSSSGDCSGREDGDSGSEIYMTQHRPNSLKTDNKKKIFTHSTSATSQRFRVSENLQHHPDSDSVKEYEKKKTRFSRIQSRPRRNSYKRYYLTILFIPGCPAV